MSDPERAPQYRGPYCPCGRDLQRPGQRTCKQCHSERMKHWRTRPKFTLVEKFELLEFIRKKAREARAYSSSREAEAIAAEPHRARFAKEIADRHRREALRFETLIRVVEAL